VLAGIEDCGSGGHGIGLGGGVGLWLWYGYAIRRFVMWVARFVFLCARDLKCKMWVLLFNALPFNRGCHSLLVLSTGFVFYVISLRLFLSHN